MDALKGEKKNLYARTRCTNEPKLRENFVWNDKIKKNWVARKFHRNTVVFFSYTQGSVKKERLNFPAGRLSFSCPIAHNTHSYFRRNFPLKWRPVNRTTLRAPLHDHFVFNGENWTATIYDRVILLTLKSGGRKTAKKSWSIPNEIDMVFSILSGWRVPYCHYYLQKVAHAQICRKRPQTGR